MADLKITTDVRVTATLEVSEGQLRALDALAGYGANAFFKAFYVKLGKSYMQPFEADMRELFNLINQQVPQALREIAEARKVLNLPPRDGKYIKKGSEA